MPCYESKRGFHPCDYNGFLKLKRLHKEYYKGLRIIAQHKRWERKQQQNRKAEPELPGVYKDICESDVVFIYHRARMPMAGPEGVDGISDSRWAVYDSWLERLDANARSWC
jgi:hypothetical protein